MKPEKKKPPRNYVLSRQKGGHDVSVFFHHSTWIYTLFTANFMEIYWSFLYSTTVELCISILNEKEAMSSVSLWIPLDTLQHIACSQVEAGSWHKSTLYGSMIDTFRKQNPIYTMCLLPVLCSFLVVSTDKENWKGVSLGHPYSFQAGSPK